MSGGDRHQRWSEDLAAYMLGALEPGEAARFEQHLEGCDTCRVEVRWFEPAVQALPEAVELRQPPRSLRKSLMAEVRADARPAQPRARWSWKPALAFAVMVLAVAGAAGYEIGNGGSGSGGGASTVVSRQPDGITVRMVREGDGGTLRLAHVHQLPPGKVLEAWVRREGQVEPVPALFVPDRAGRASTTIADMRGVDTVMVTTEPQGGSKQPTSEPLVTMSVPQ
jgi:anti-sigma-K factor RskA